MRFLFATCVISIGLFSQFIEAKCHKHEKCHICPQGPTGATGPIGPQGATGNIINNYASVASDVQSIIFTGANFPINFPNDLVPPVGILHPYLGDDSRFLIEDSGLYQISWTVPVEWDVTSENIVELYLYDAATLSYFLPSPISRESFDDITNSSSTSRYRTISGQTIVSLNTGTIVQLLIHVTGVITGVKQARFTINKITNQ